MTQTWFLAAVRVGFALVAAFGLSRGIIDQTQYSYLAATVIASG